MQARTDASFVRETGDGRLMRVPAYFATPAVTRQRGSRLRYRHPAIQSTIQGGPVEQAWLELQYRACQPLRLVHTSLSSAAQLYVRSHARLFVEKTLYSKRPKQRREMLRLERVVGVIPRCPRPTTFVKLQRLRTLSKRRGVDFPCPNKTNPPFRKTQPLHIHQRFGLRRE